MRRKFTGEEERPGMMTKIQSSLGMKKVSWFIMIVMAISLFSLNVFALEITEIELNPEGDDSGNEWIELYSKDEIDLDGFYLENNDGDIYNISGSFSDYLAIGFDKQFLDNKEEKIILKDEDGEIIDETDELDDEDNDDLIWRICDGDWEFTEETKDEENECDEKEGGTEKDELSDELIEFNKERNENTENQENESSDENSAQEFIGVVVPEKTGEKLVLNAPNSDEEVIEEKAEENEFVSKQEKLRLGIVYSFLGFCVVLIALLSLRRL